MKKWTLPILVYFIVVIVTMTIQASDGYNNFFWKLFVAQLYAIPSLFITKVFSEAIDTRN